VADQYVRAATGAGANYDEARAAESKADFIHKLGVAAKEMREASYWTDLVARSGWLQLDLRAHAREARELAAILGASLRTARARGESDR
jgi:four helix bundle protein